MGYNEILDEDYESSSEDDIEDEFEQLYDAMFEDDKDTRNNTKHPGSPLNKGKATAKEIERYLLDE